MPSERLKVSNDWAAYQLDNAVAYTGIVIDNALQERVKTGTDEHPKYEDKYTLKQLCAPDFRLPLDDELDEFDVSDFAGMSDVVVDEVS